MQQFVLEISSHNVVHNFALPHIAVDCTFIQFLFACRAVAELDVTLLLNQIHIHYRH